MEIKKFNVVEGLYIEKIPCQDLLAYGIPDNEDFYDVAEAQEYGGYHGSTISFYNIKTCEVYKPFEKERNILYGRPIYSEGLYYFLQADFNSKLISLFEFFPEKKLDVVKTFDLNSVHLYNLHLIGNKVHVTSQGEYFRCYYPEVFSFKLEGNETVSLIDEDKVYVEAWIEEGWDEKLGCASENYKYYSKVLVKDFEGNTLSEEIGQLYQDNGGNWWIS